ncbi:MAG TPA: TonB family protein [Thermoanaerobaculaceae bacterium]|nr:TonB family protein [Thermoanaerobaculaceae bacterium]
MIDPVSDELTQRARMHLPWRWALASALTLHLATGFALLLGGHRQPRAFSLPSVQVRLAAALPGPARPAGAPGGPARASSRPRAIATAPLPPAHKTVQAERTPGRVRPTPRPAAGDQAPEAADATSRPGAAGPSGPPGSGSLGGRPDGQAGVSGGIALGAGSGTEEVFPFSYYLNRVLGSIEGNWFKPPVPPETRCRVRCRIDRSGRLVEAGIEEPSATPAFDRAALRAVYASAPFPPLPLGFTGASLTIHLEFGP